MTGLSIRNLDSGYTDKAVVKDLSLEVGPHETLIVMGPSGSGKTTLLLTILGVLTPTGGEMELDGESLTARPIEERNIGYLPQDYGLFPHLTVAENITYGLRVRGIPRDERQEAAGGMLSMVELAGLGQRKIRELSGGQRQRVGLARALAIKPSLILLDEPLSNIDQVTKAEVAARMKELFQKLEIPVVLVTHSREDARFLGGRLAIMIDGRIEQLDTVENIIKAPRTPYIRRLLMPFDETA
jgi:ABC-type Fe3+/spermidine/putrescine transport system ATPase subunit